MAALKWLRIVFLKNAKGCAELGCDAEHARWTERRHHVSTGQIEDSYLCDEHAAQRRDESKETTHLISAQCACSRRRCLPLPDRRSHEHPVGARFRDCVAAQPAVARRADELVAVRSPDGSCCIVTGWPLHSACWKISTAIEP